MVLFLQTLPVYDGVDALNGFVQRKVHQIGFDAVKVGEIHNAPMLAARSAQIEALQPEGAKRVPSFFEPGDRIAVNANIDIALARPRKLRFPGFSDGRNFIHG